MAASAAKVGACARFCGSEPGTIGPSYPRNSLLGRSDGSIGWRFVLGRDSLPRISGPAPPVFRCCENARGRVVLVRHAFTSRPSASADFWQTIRLTMGCFGFAVFLRYGLMVVGLGALVGTIPSTLVVPSITPSAAVRLRCRVVPVVVGSC